MENGSELRVLVIKDGDFFVAQCLEYDICTQGASEEEALSRMDCLIELERNETLDDTGKEFGGLDSAPELFHNMWRQGECRSSNGGSYEVAFAA